MPRLDGLTGVRFLAALAVLVYHYAIPWFDQLPPIIGPIIRSGYLGVSLFFALSGFILAFTYGVVNDRRSFWWARFSRIYPVYALGLLVAMPIFILDVRGGAFTLPQGALAGALTPMALQAWWPQVALAWNVPGWTLSNEAFFYLLFPFLLPLLARVTTAWTAVVGMLICWIAMLLPVTLAYILNPSVLALADGDHGVAASILKYFPLMHLPTFVSGMLLARLYKVRPPTNAALAGWAGAGLILAVQFPAPHLLMHNGLFLPLMLAVIYGLTASRGVLAHPIMVLLGGASYAMYILHVAAWPYLARLFEALGIRGVAIPVAVGASIVLLSILVYRMIEVPAQRWLRRIRDTQTLSTPDMIAARGPGRAEP